MANTGNTRGDTGNYMERSGAPLQGQSSQPTGTEDRRTNADATLGNIGNEPVAENARAQQKTELQSAAHDQQAQFGTAGQRPEELGAQKGGSTIREGNYQGGNAGRGDRQSDMGTGSHGRRKNEDDSDSDGSQSRSRGR